MCGKGEVRLVASTKLIPICLSNQKWGKKRRHKHQHKTLRHGKIILFRSGKLPAGVQILIWVTWEVAIHKREHSEERASVQLVRNIPTPGHGINTCQAKRVMH